MAERVNVNIWTPKERALGAFVVFFKCIYFFTNTYGFTFRKFNYTFKPCNSLKPCMTLSTISQTRQNIQQLSRVVMEMNYRMKLVPWFQFNDLRL